MHFDIIIKTRPNNTEQVFFSDINHVHAVNYTYKHLTQNQLKALSEFGIKIPPHFIALKEKLHSTNIYNSDLVNKIVLSAMFDNNIYLIVQDEKITGLKTNSLSLGDIVSVVNSSNEFVLVDIDISDDTYILVEIADQEVKGLVKVFECQIFT
ncbi:hypothetical protein [Thalassotalea piscium]|uniref:Uncharacterized protein n=1 Tax=Thalassotalea piscium TaxID=1230533 RepID=A0A7X0NGL8_9GAMM|nr:hypothetical protein [Thalassotalea piscium]MBB6543034.1 hypothetical protein [Thalassotalea piscium]